MRYICENGHIFEHTAKQISKVSEAESYEIPVCPICVTRIYSEYILDDTITSVISVSLDDVDEKLKEGYKVESLYAKTATLIKKE